MVFELHTINYFNMYNKISKVVLSLLSKFSMC